MLVAALLVGEALASRVVVNEIYRDTSLGSTGTEWVEVVLLEELTAAELETFSFGDSTSSTAAKSSGYHLQNAADFAAVFPAGTILVIAGGSGATEDLTFDPASGDWNLVIRTTDAHVVSNGSTGDFAGTDVAYVDLDGTNGDATLSADGFAVNWDSSPGAFGAVAPVTIAVPPSVGATANTSDLANAADPAVWAVPAAATPGAGNGGDNDLAIDALRGGGACADADGDGVCDDVDVCLNGDDTLDADADGVPDDCDVCAGGDDGVDQDADGTPNECDLRLQLAGTVAPGQVITLRAVRALPGETVSFRWSPGGLGAGPCPANLGGHCYDLGNPTSLVGNDVADANGVAQRRFTVPAGAVVGSTITFQAAVARGVGGVDSDLTQAIPRVVQP
jgi:hypothetical protein